MSNAFNLSQLANNVNSSGQVANTGLQNNSVTVTAGTGMSGGGSAALGGSVTLTNAGVTSVAAGTGISVSGSTGAVTISNTSVGGQLQTKLFTSPGTFTVPSTLTQVRVTVVGGGGGGSDFPGNSSGGYGGLASAICPVTTGTPISVTVGSGGSGYIAPGTPATSGGTSSFGSLASATGGGVSSAPGTSGTPGSGTVSTGTSIKTNNMSSGNFSQIQGASSNPSSNGASAIAYSTSVAYIAGGNGGNTPVTAPGGGGVGGAVVVEWVG